MSSLLVLPLLGFAEHESSVNIKPGINFKRDSTSGVVTAGECDGSHAIPVLSSIADSTGVQALQDALVSVLGSSILNTEVSSNYTVDGATV